MDAKEKQEVTKTPEKKKKKGGAWKAVVAAVLVAGVAGSTTLSAFNLLTLKSYIAEREKEDNPETTEDYVKIAESYEILPTTNISDAYKSGDTSNLSDKEKETLDLAQSAIKEMKIRDGMSDYEKEKAVYDWMSTKLQQDQGALTVIPSTQEDCDKPYGVLKYHNAVCVGYATTFRMFMEMMDIECMVEHNNEKYHSWNLVKLDDDWYITDVYSDAGKGNYAHFNMTDAMFGQEQTWDHDFFPAANSLKYNLVFKNRKILDSVYDLPKALREAMDQKMGSVMVAFKDKVGDEDARIVSAIATSMDNMLMSGSYKNMPYALGNYSWMQDPEGNYIYRVVFGDYNTDAAAGQNLSEKQQKKVEKAVEKALEGLTPSYGEGAMGEGAEGNMSEEVPSGKSMK